MIRRIALAGILTAGLIAPLAVTTPVGAGSRVGCTGNGCSVLLSNAIMLSGTAAGGSGYAPPAVNVVPPCLWEPIGDAVTGSQYIVQNYGAIGPNSYFGVTQSVQLAKKLLKQNPPPPGTWYELPTNPAAPQAAQQQCQKLPLFYFDRPGQPLPAPPVSPEMLAQYAYNNMRIPGPRLWLNPQNKGYVNLGTYVWTKWPKLLKQVRPLAYFIRAQLGAEIVTVWVQATAFQLDVTGPGTPYSANCSYKTGSRYPFEKPPANSGPGTPPDCGVLWQGPTASATIAVTVNWHVTWGPGAFLRPGPNTLPRPASSDLTTTSRGMGLRVVEIQSINGG